MEQEELGEDTYVVERILDHKVNEKNEIVQYKVRWRGYKADSDSWVEVTGMNCPVLLKRYEAHLARKRGEKVDGKFHKWTVERVNEDSDEEDEEDSVFEKDKNHDDSIVNALRSRGKKLPKETCGRRRRGAGASEPSENDEKCNISYTLFYEAGLPSSSDEESRKNLNFDDDTDDSDYDLRKNNLRSRRKSFSSSRKFTKKRASTIRRRRRSASPLSSCRADSRRECAAVQDGLACRSNDQRHGGPSRLVEHESMGRIARLEPTASLKRRRSKSGVVGRPAKHPKPNFDSGFVEQTFSTRLLPSIENSFLGGENSNMANYISNIPITNIDTGSFVESASAVAAISFSSTATTSSPPQLFPYDNNNNSLPNQPITNFAACLPLSQPNAGFCFESSDGNFTTAQDMQIQIPSSSSSSSMTSPLNTVPVFDESTLDRILRAVSPSLCADGVNFVDINNDICEIVASSPPEVSPTYANFQDSEIQTATMPTVIQELTAVPGHVSQDQATTCQQSEQIHTTIVKGILDTLYRLNGYWTAPKKLSINDTPSPVEKQAYTGHLADAILSANMANAKKLLLDYRACDLNLQTLYRGETLIAMCCRTKCDSRHLTCEIIEHLVFSGVDVNAFCQTGFTALMVASMNGHLCQVKTLLKRGARTNDIVARDGYNALQLAIQHCPVENAESVISVLLYSGADVTWCNFFNNFTPLMLANSVQKLFLSNTIKDIINRQEQEFANALLKQTPSIRFESYFQVELKCVEILATNEHQIKIWANRDQLVAGYCIVLCLTGLDVTECCRKYFPANTERLVDVYFNGQSLKTINTGISGPINIFQLQPWNVGGENILSIKNVMFKGCLKVMLQVSRVQYLQPCGFLY